MSDLEQKSEEQMSNRAKSEWAKEQISNPGSNGQL